MWWQYNPMGAGMDEAQLMREQQMYEQQMMVRTSALVFLAAARGGAGVDWGAWCAADATAAAADADGHGAAPAVRLLSTFFAGTPTRSHHPKACHWTLVGLVHPKSSIPPQLIA